MSAITFEAMERFLGEIPSIMKDEHNECLPAKVDLGCSSDCDGYTYMRIHNDDETEYLVLPGEWVIRWENNWFSNAPADTFRLEGAP